MHSEENVIINNLKNILSQGYKAQYKMDRVEVTLDLKDENLRKHNKEGLKVYHLSI